MDQEMNGLKREDLLEYAVILAGGKSSRMGFDKQLLEKNHERLAVSLAAELKKLFKNVIVVTKTPEYYDGYDVITCQDVYPGKGPMAGIHAAFCATDAKAVFVMACDMTSFSKEYALYEAEKMVREKTDASITMNGEQMETFHAFYSRTLLGEMEKRLCADQNSLNRMLREMNVSKSGLDECLRYTDPAGLFRNLNTPQDYEKFRMEKR